MSCIYYQGAFQRAFGTFPLRKSELARALKDALDVGYRAFDTAQMYGNEAELGEALAALAYPRDQLCITTKVHPDNFAEERFLPSVKKSLQDLRVDFTDVLLLHWPPADGNVVPSLQLLEEAQKQGLSRFIGVSNYTVAMMRKAKATIDTPLVTNQVEFHPLLNQDRLLAGSSETGIPLSSYCSLARGEVLKHQIFSDLAGVYGKSAGQVALRWILQKGVSINTMSTKRANMAANFDVMDFTLSSIDMARLDRVTETNYRIVDASLAPWAPEWD